MDNQAPYGFSGFSFIGERLCLDFANTVGDHAADAPEEHLHSYADLVLWGEQASVLTAAETEHLQGEAAKHPAAAAAVLERAIVLREAIYRLFSAFVAGATPAVDDLAILNAALKIAPVQLYVAAVEDQYVCDWLTDKVTLGGVLGPVAWSAANLLTSDEVRWVKACGGDECGWLFLDTTKNHSRRWCDMADCGSRAKAKRYYQRKRTR